MNHTNRCVAGVLAAVVGLSLCLCACGGTAPDEPDTTPTTTVPWVAEAPEVTDISGLLTAAEVSEAVHAKMGEGTLQEQGTLLVFTSADYQTTVSVLVEAVDDNAATRFSAILSMYPPESLVLAPNLGDEAYWSADTGELLMKKGNHLLSVNLVCPGFSNDNLLVAARQLATLAVGRLTA